MVMILAAALEIKELIPIDEIINSKCSKMKVDLTRDYWVHLSESGIDDNIKKFYYLNIKNR